MAYEFAGIEDANPEEVLAFHNWSEGTNIWSGSFRGKLDAVDPRLTRLSTGLDIATNSVGADLRVLSQRSKDEQIAWHLRAIQEQKTKREQRGKVSEDTICRNCQSTMGLRSANAAGQLLCDSCVLSALVLHFLSRVTRLINLIRSFTQPLSERHQKPALG